MPGSASDGMSSVKVFVVLAPVSMSTYGKVKLLFTITAPPEATVRLSAEKLTFLEVFPRLWMVRLRSICWPGIPISTHLSSVSST